jgi:hypothetical protein
MEPDERVALISSVENRMRFGRRAFRICLVQEPVKYSLTSGLKSPVTKARFQAR